MLTEIQLPGLSPGTVHPEARGAGGIPSIRLVEVCINRTRLS